MSVKHYDWTAYHAGVRGSKVAIVDLDTQEEVTYGTLDDRANRLGEWMQSKGGQGRSGGGADAQLP